MNTGSAGSNFTPGHETLYSGSVVFFRGVEIDTASTLPTNNCATCHNSLSIPTPSDGGNGMMYCAAMLAESAKVEFLTPETRISGQTQVALNVCNNLRTVRGVVDSDNQVAAATDFTQHFPPLLAEFGVTGLHEDVARLSELPVSRSTRSGVSGLAELAALLGPINRIDEMDQYRMIFDPSDPTMLKPSINELLLQIKAKRLSQPDAMAMMGDTFDFLASSTNHARVAMMGSTLAEALVLIMRLSTNPEGAFSFFAPKTVDESSFSRAAISLDGFPVRTSPDVITVASQVDGSFGVSLEQVKSSNGLQGPDSDLFETFRIPTYHPDVRVSVVGSDPQTLLPDLSNITAGPHHALATPTRLVDFGDLHFRPIGL